MANVLVTGGSGFIGRRLVEGLSGQHRVVAPTSAELDLLDAEATGAYLRTHAFDVVVHAATWDATRTSQKTPGLVLENNLRMFHNLARDRSAFARLVNLGSGAEYDRGRELVRVSEQECGAVVPGDQYGFSKYLIRLHCSSTADFVNLSLFGVFGPGEDWRFRFISNACCHALLDLPIEINQDALFDYIAVEDVVTAVSWCLSHDVGPASYNVCSGESRSLRSLAELVREISGKDLPITTRLPGRGRAYVGDPSRFMEIAGWRPRDLRGAVGELYGWYEGRLGDISREALQERCWVTD